MQDKDNNIDDLFNSGLSNFQPDAPDGLWDKLHQNLKDERRFHPVDDLFYDKLAGNNSRPPLTVWSRLRQSLGNTIEAGIQKSLDSYEPSPPGWVWQSLRFVLTTNRVQKNRRRVAVVAGVTVFAGLLAGMQWGMYSLMPETAITEPHPKLHIAVAKQHAAASKSYYGWVKQHAKAGSPVSASSIRVRGTLPAQWPALPAIPNPFTPTQAIEPIPAPMPETSFQPVAANVKSFILSPSAIASLPGPAPLSPPTPHRGKPVLPASSWTISLLGGATHSFRTLSGDPANQYLHIRNSSEQARVTACGGIRFGYSLTNHWQVSAAFSYMQRGEKAEYNFNSNQDVTLLVQFRDPATNYFSVPYKYTAQNQQYQVANNCYTYLELPVQVGYRFRLGNINLIPSAGLSAGWLASASGTNLTVETNPTLVGLEKMERGSLSRLNLSQQVSLAVSLPLSRNLSLIAEPFYSRSFTNSLRNNMDVKQYFHSKGLWAGLQVKL